MKTLRLSLLVGALFLPAALSAASFEGKVNFSMSADRKPSQEIHYSIKGGRIRIDLPGQQGMGGMIMEPAKKETIVIMDEQKMYMVMSQPDAPAAEGDAKAGEARLEKTGETQKILGHLAEKYLATDRDSKTELWLAEGLGAFMAFQEPNPMGGKGRKSGGAASQGWERALAGKDLFPLRVVSTDKSGRESFRMEATAISAEKLPDSLFAPPAGYEKFDMGGMMKGLMPGGLPGLRR
jgi:hypothetical protein